MNGGYSNWQLVDSSVPSLLAGFYASGRRYFVRAFVVLLINQSDVTVEILARTSQLIAAACSRSPHQRHYCTALTLFPFFL